MRTFLLFFAAMLGMLLVHEVGHYLAAVLLGIPVHGFSLGAGPLLLSFEASGYEWMLHLLPVMAAVHFPPDVAAAIPHGPGLVVVSSGIGLASLFGLVLWGILRLFRVPVRYSGPMAHARTPQPGEWSLGWFTIAARSEAQSYSAWVRVAFYGLAVAAYMAALNLLPIKGFDGYQILVEGARLWFSPDFAMPSWWGHPVAFGAMLGGALSVMPFAGSLSPPKPSEPLEREPVEEPAMLIAE